MGSVNLFFSCTDLTVPEIASNTSWKGALSRLGASGGSKYPLMYCSVQCLDEHEHLVKEMETDRQRGMALNFNKGMYISEAESFERIVVTIQWIENDIPLTFGRTSCTKSTLLNLGTLTFPIENPHACASACLTVHAIACPTLPFQYTFLKPRNPLYRVFQFPIPSSNSTSENTNIENTETTQYVTVREDVAEVDLALDVPHLFLKLCSDEMAAIVSSWRHRLKNRRLEELRFENDQEALDHGYTVYKVAVRRGRNLVLNPNQDTLGQEEVEEVEEKTPSSSVFGKFKKKAGKWASATAKTLEVVGISPGSDPSASPRAPIMTCECHPSVSLHETHVDGSRTFIGQTNTQTHTTEPVWFSNPSQTHHPNGTNSMKHQNLDATLGDNVQLHDRVNFVFYRKTSCAKGLEFHVQSDAGLDTRSTIGMVSLEYLELEPIMVSDQDKEWCQSTNWFPIENPSGTSKGGCGEIQISLSIQKAKPHSKEERHMNELEPFMTNTNLFLQESSGPSSSDLSLTFLETHMQTLETQHAEVQDMITRCLNSSTFKSSQLKKDRPLQALATNLHMCSISIFRNKEEEDNDELDHQRVGVVTAGAPTAHALGLDDGRGLLDLTRDLKHMSESKLDNDDEHEPPTRARKGKFGKSFQAPLGSSSSAAVEERLECLLAEINFRKIAVMSQCLSICITSFLVHLEHVCHCQAQKKDKAESPLEQLVLLGYLVGWESLISSQGKELSMLGDTWTALRILSDTFAFVLEAPDMGKPKMEFILGSQSKIRIHVRLPASMHVPPEVLEAPITIVPVLFTQGINEMQSLANMINHGGIGLQTQINQSSMDILLQYYQDVVRMHEVRTLEESKTEQLRRLETLHAQTLTALASRIGTSATKSEKSISGKDTSILLHASDAVRALGGGRITFCKSGKDRTAMSLTLEEARLVTKFVDIRHLDSNTRSGFALRTANVLREYGVRMAIAEKNVGRPKYSFNALQRKLLPEIYRPPMSTIQTMMTSVAARDS